MGTNADTELCYMLCMTVSVCVFKGSAGWEGDRRQLFYRASIIYKTNM